MSMTCIPKEYAPKLRALLEKENLTIAKLYQMPSSEHRRNVFAKALDPETAQQVNALFEKAMVSNQRTAITNWIWKNLYGGTALYKGLTLQMSNDLRDNLSMADLAKMTPAERLEALNKHIGDDRIAAKVAGHYEQLRSSGNLANWETRVFGTDRLRQDKRVKGAFARLEVLDDLGVLSPKQMETFMEDYVADVMGVNLTVDEAQEISNRTKELSKALEKADPDWTWQNRDNLVEYYKQVRGLQDYMDSLNPESPVKVFLSVGARGSILLSVRSAVNSLTYQVVPTIGQSFIKRLTAGSLLPGDYTKMEKLAAVAAATTDIRLSHIKNIWKQTLMGWEIYRKTGFDIARMERIDDHVKYFGERFTHIQGPSFKESKGPAAKAAAVVRRHAKMMMWGLKYAAGTTDVWAANLHRAGTSYFAGKMFAYAELHRGKISKDQLNDRIDFYFDDASRPVPTTEDGAIIRMAGMADAHKANFSGKDFYSKHAEAARKVLGLNNETLGQALIAFARIPANAYGTSLEMTGPGFARGIAQIFNASKIPDPTQKRLAVANGFATLYRTGGGLGLALLLTSLLFDDDDYIGRYDWRESSFNELTRLKNANAESIRIFGVWLKLDKLGPLAIPIAAIMEARQAHARGGSPALGYVQGIFTGILQAPVLKDVWSWKESTERAAKANDAETIAKALKATPEDMARWVAIRTITGTVAHDVYGFFGKPKSDAFGRPVPHKSDTIFVGVQSFFTGANVKYDTSDAITKEFDRLNLKGYLPTLAQPSGANAEAVRKHLGDEAYEDLVNGLKQKYAAEVLKLIQSDRYRRRDPAQQRSAINDIRKKTITDVIERQARPIRRAEGGKK